MSEYIGQYELVENLRVAITAARKRNEPLEHVLFHGPPGLGKTTLAHIISAEMDANIHTTSGPALERPGDLMGILTNLEVGDVLFIDEIHRLSRTVEEFLYSAMEDFVVSFVVGKGTFAKTIRVPLRRFTLIGATTRSGMLTAPLRERFGLFYHLEFYTDEELAEVVRRSARILEIPTDQGAADEVARRSRGTPRIANRLLRRVRDYAEVKGNGTVDVEVAETALTRERVDTLGLNRLDRRYLEAILTNYEGGPVGIEALAATLNEERETLEDSVEPFLLKLGFVSRTPAGRRAGAGAYEHLGIQAPAGQDQARLL